MRHSLDSRPVLALRSVLVGCVVAVLAGCGGERSAGPGGPARELPDQEVSDFALTETDEGRPLWKLYARDAATYSSRGMVIAHAVRVDFYDERGRRSSVLTAREGDLNQRTHDMTARGNVVLQTTEGTRLSTEELRFINRSQKIVVPADQRVRVERGEDVLTGYGFESDPDLRHYEFKSRIEATVRSRPADLGETPGEEP